MRFAVDSHGVARLFAVGVGIEVAGHRLSLQPSGYAQLHVKGTGAVLVDGDGDVAVPGVAGLLRQPHLLSVHVEHTAVRHEEVDVDRAVLDGIDIAWQ